MIPHIDYYKPRTIKEALYHLNKQKNTSILAGGTDLVVRLRNQFCAPSSLIDIKDIGDLNEIKEFSKEVFIGSTVTFYEISKSTVIEKHLPTLKQAAEMMGSPQIRNIATLGGNVQTASPAGDGLVSLFGSEARIELASEIGERQIPIENFVTGPQKTVKRSNELIKGFYIPKGRWNRQKFFKIGKRNALAISIVNGVIRLCIDYNKTIKDCRIVLGAVAPTPIRIKEAEQMLIGKNYTYEADKKLKEIIQNSIKPISDVRASKEYRKYISAVMCSRLMREILEF